MGAAALEGRPGILSVERGFRGFQEINRVVYDPQVVTVPQMERWLRRSGTYVRTVEPEEPSAPGDASPRRQP